MLGYAFRVVALYRAWEEPLAKEPAGVYVHDDGRPMLGRKLKDKSKRELDYLGLAVHKDGGERSTRSRSARRVLARPPDRGRDYGPRRCSASVAGAAKTDVARGGVR